jgi:hypothetical protein
MRGKSPTLTFSLRHSSIYNNQPPSYVQCNSKPHPPFCPCHESLRRRRPGCRRVRAGGSLGDGVVGADAARLLRDGLGAGNLLERDARVVGSLEPVEAPVASSLDLGWETVAIASGVDAAVSVAPAVRRGSVLVRACVELSVSTSTRTTAEGLGDVTYPTPPPGICLRLISQHVPVDAALHSQWMCRMLRRAASPSYCTHNDAVWK